MVRSSIPQDYNCSNVQHDRNSFEVLKQCKSDFQAKIHEALLIKKHRQSLNKQYYMLMARTFCQMSTNNRNVR